MSEMVFAPHAWTRWTALLAAACLFLLFQTRLAGTVTGASLEVRSVPAGAEVWLDGKAVGQTNATVDALSGGTVEVEVRLPGYRVARQRVELERGKTALVVFSLEAQAVEVSLKVEGPERFKVEIGPSPVRKEESPKKLLLEPGVYDLTVTADDYKTRRKQLEVKAGKPASLKLALEERPAPTPEPTPRPVVVAAPAAPAYVPPAYVPPRYVPPAPRYYPPVPRYVPPPPVYQPRAIFTPVPAPIMTPL